MPEAPEIKKYARTFRRRLVGKSIIHIDVVGGKWLAQDKLPTQLFATNKHRLYDLPLLNVVNNGKVLIFEFAGVWLVLQMMLVGKMSLASFGTNHIIFDFGEEQLYFVDKMNLAHIYIFTQADKYEEFVAKLGPDCSNPRRGDAERFYQLLSRRRAKLSRVLLDQKVCSGCGNYLRAEAIYMAGIDPFATCPISREQAEKLWSALVEISKLRLRGEYEFKVYKIGKKIKEGNRTFWY